MFHDVLFPTGISYGSRGGPGFSTNIIETDSGAEQRVARRDQANHSFEVSYGVKSLLDLTEVRDFYMSRFGCAYSFRYKDWMDFTSAIGGLGAPALTDQLLGTGDGVKTTFQLVKRYQDATSTLIRTITKPVSGTVLVAFDGVNQASGWTVNLTTGVITFTSPPGIGVVITVGFEFHVVVRFGKEIDKQLSQSIEGFDSGLIPSIPLVEVMDTTQVDSDFPYGGTHNLVFGFDSSLSLTNGRTQVCSATATGLNLVLPNYASLPTGGPIVTLINVGANSFTVKTHLGGTVVALASTKATMLFLGVDSVGTKVWYAI